MLTTASGEFVAFGFEAEQQYGEALEDDDDDVSAGLLLFRHFKMMLMKNKVKPSKH